MSVMSWNPYEPCPNCDTQADNFRQVVRQVEDISLDPNGEMTDAVVIGDSFEIVAVACTECDEVILGDEDDLPF